MFMTWIPDKSVIQFPTEVRSPFNDWIHVHDLNTLVVHCTQGSSEDAFKTKVAEFFGESHLWNRHVKITLAFVFGQIYLYSHNYCHHNEMACEICGQVLLGSNSMARHRLKNHATPQDFLCPHCGQGFKARAYLRQKHMSWLNWVDSVVKAYIPSLSAFLLSEF